jgi:UDP-N-acetylmuramate dehydrogenase
MIYQTVPLADKNWFGTGGPARYFYEPTDAFAFQVALDFAQKNSLPLFILGSGANILISDEGFDGLVIRPQLKNISHYAIDQHYAHVAADSGVQLDDLIEYCLNHNLSGLEEFSGIPGTVGGAVFINLHYFEFLIDQFIIEAEVIEKKTNIIQKVDRAWFNFGYNQSRLLDGHHYLMQATFLLKRITDEEKAFARGRKKEIIRHRKARYPSLGTCGSFFRNFHPEEVSLESNGKKMIYVAYYLDKIGIKGALSIGDAHVSHQHANMIVNKGKASSRDIIAVAQTMQKLVFDQFGLIPQPECRLIGFREYPLLP